MEYEELKDSLSTVIEDWAEKHKEHIYYKSNVVVAATTVPRYFSNTIADMTFDAFIIEPKKLVTYKD